MIATDGQISIQSHAKLNLGLEVLGRRDDDYHEIITVLHELSTYDEFIWKETNQPFTYVSPPEIGADRDLVRRALDLAPDQGAWTGTLRLQKHVPVAAGLGGGSSNAALALRLAFPGPIDDALIERARNLGSDVPFFLRGGTALATGNGTTLHPLPSPDLWFVIVVPDVSIPAKTAVMYALLTPGDFSEGAQSRAIADAITRGLPLPSEFPNVFMQRFPGNQAFHVARQAMFDVLGQCALSGAGPALFAVFPNRDAAYAARARLPVGIGWVTVTASASARDDRHLAQLGAALRGTIHA